MTAAARFRSLLAGEGLRTVAQPVVRFRDDGVKLEGYELLSRGPESTNFEHPKVLFEYSRQSGAEADLDLACARVAFRFAAGIARGYTIFFNVHCASLQRGEGWVDEVLSAAHEAGVCVPDLVLEIVEHAPFAAGTPFHRALARIRREGARIALDDFGARNSGFTLLVEARPEIVKIDAGIVRGSSEDPWRAAILRSIVALAGDAGFATVAEGVETNADLELVGRVGVHMAQGFVIGAPLARLQGPELEAGAVRHLSEGEGCSA